MSTNQSAQRYGDTFYFSMQEKKLLEVGVRDADILVNLSEKEERFTSFLNSEVLPVAQKLSILDKLFSKTLHQETYKFLRFMVYKQRSNLIVSMASAFLRRYCEKAGIIEGSLVTAFPLSDEFVAEIGSTFGKKLGKKLSITTEVRPELLGGVTLQLADRLYDFSLSGKLSRLKESLLKESS